MKNNKCKIIMNLITIITTILIVAFIIYGFKENIFDSNSNLINFIKGYGIIAPIIFIFIQIIQVVFPVIPGGASCLAGVMAFGGFYGFIYNYVGLCIGSILSFLIARKYGIELINCLFKKDTVNKYLSYIKSKKFNKVFMWGIILPGAPDDLLCYLAGFSRMNLKFFILVIILGKPLTLIFYSLFSDLFIKFF